MRLIIGGEAQGKLDFAVENYSIKTDEIANGEELDIYETENFRCINSFHLFVKKLLENGKNPVDFTKEILKKNPDVIIIMNEIGSGIIPIEKSERVWREYVGRVGCFLAERAETVDRIICGIVIRIKG